MQLDKKIEEKMQLIKKIENLEITRIIKEFDFKNYAERNNIDCGTVLASLCGAKKANTEILRHGMFNFKK